MDFDELVAVAGGKAAPTPTPKSTVAPAESKLKRKPALVKPSATPKASSQSAGLKRKAEDAPENKDVAPAKKPTPPRSGKQPADKKLSSKVSSISRNKDVASKSSALTSKEPAPGSYAELMLKAKEIHAKQPSAREVYTVIDTPKLSLEERRKIRAAARAKKPKRYSPTRADKVPWPTITPKVEKEVSTYKGTVKPAPVSTYKGTVKPAAPVSTYKGTAGLPSKRVSTTGRQGLNGKKVSRKDEYLATDEEDISGDSLEEASTPESSGLSDMEAGLHDVEVEENEALRAAKVEDAKELAREMEQKKAKEERRRKLEAQAAKYRR